MTHRCFNKLTHVCLGVSRLQQDAARRCSGHCCSLSPGVVWILQQQVTDTGNQRVNRITMNCYILLKVHFEQTKKVVSYVS